MSPRTYCRLGFLLLCIAPTLATAGTVVSRRAPDWFVGSKSVWEADLSQRLGFRVSLGKIIRPQTGTTLLENVELADRETGHLVAKARLVEVAHTDQGLVLVMSQPEILIEELGSLAGTFHETVLRVSNSTGNIHVLASELLLKSPDKSQSFAGVDGLIEGLPTGSRATIRFRLPERTGGEPAQLRVIRDREKSPPSTRWELHSGSEPLPCSLLAPYLPSLAMLGDECEFHGVAWGEQTVSGWEGDVNGRLSNVNLESLVTQRFPHKLSGLAEIKLNRARFQGGRLVDAAGSFDSPGGVIGRTLIDAAAESLALETADQVAKTKRWPIRYSRLAAGISISESGLSIDGACDDEGAVISSAEGPLLTSPPNHGVPVVALVRALSPDSRVQVPATAETDALLQSLPIPPLAPPAKESNRPPTATVRLKDAK